MIQVTTRGIGAALRNLSRTGSSLRGLTPEDFALETSDRARIYLIGSIIARNQGKWLSHGNPGLRTGGIRVVRASDKAWKVVASSRGVGGYDYTDAVEFGRGAIVLNRPDRPMPLASNKGIAFRFAVKAAPGYHFMERARNWAASRFARYMGVRVSDIIKSKGNVTTFRTGLFESA